VPTLVWNNRVDTVQMFNVLDHVNALDAMEAAERSFCISH
jgi:hypothetical protein